MMLPERYRDMTTDELQARLRELKARLEADRMALR